MKNDLPRPGLFHWWASGLARWFWPLLGELRAEGIEHVPATGPFLLISNHQSVLDPFFIASFCKRQCFIMAKSTQFASPVFGFLMKRLYGFPVRRYQVDPQAARVALRRLSEGEAVHIYIEGERTWDGSLQDPRPGTVRIALKAGVPIIPCVVDGAYDAWPRWSRTIRRTNVRVAFGPAIHFRPFASRAEREAALPEASERIMSTLAAMLGVEPPHARHAGLQDSTPDGGNLAQRAALSPSRGEP
jgi:1-acyl-sn-glycerol-3-phosphate acyltransferase